MVACDGCGPTREIPENLAFDRQEEAKKADSMGMTDQAVKSFIDIAP